ncbi:uncharacterized protein LODBEIA_P08540 [Lodderomyces beijingensis]|uniref:Ubiquitin-like domain-containing protein n=1 Tax=Lodderomyces beijingensis TaxID=1775926 RepID=A0ABP0ZK09_9ASCO
MSSSSSPPQLTEEIGAIADLRNKISLTLEVDEHTNSTYTIKRNTKLRKLIRIFCQRHYQDIKTLRFIYYGEQIKPTDTPNTLRMEDNDSILVVGYVEGG